MSNTFFKRKVTFRIQENKTKFECVDKERTQMVYTKCEANPWGVCSLRVNANSVLGLVW